MSKITAYIDDSWSADEQVFVLSAYVATDEAWQSFEPLWRDALDSASRPVREWKTSDARHGVAEFSGLGKVERVELTKRVVGVIADHMPHTEFVGYSSATALQGAATPEWRRTWQEQAFRITATQILFRIVEFAGHAASDSDPDGALHVVFDEKPGFRGIVESMWPIVVERIPESVRHVLPHAPEWAKSHECLPLQAADLLAYETAHEAKQRLRSRPLAVSKALARLVEARQHWANCTWNADIANLVALLRQGHNIDEQAQFLGNTLYESGQPWRDGGHWPKPLLSRQRPEPAGPQLRGGRRDVSIIIQKAVKAALDDAPERDVADEVAPRDGPS